jgi:plasmid stabilization system protein ParE
MNPYYRLTKGASADLENIIHHTIAKWGEAQCRAYVDQLEKTSLRSPKVKEYSKI